MNTEFNPSNDTESTLDSPRIQLNADTALALLMAMRDTVDGAIELTLFDTNGQAVVFELDADCHEYLPAEAGQVSLFADAE